MKPKFGPGDKVFAKVRGYPPWPARVEGLADETPNRMRYHIYFYGTGETAIVKAEDICSFVDNRERLGKPKKHKNFTDALLQIEAELSPAEIKASLEPQQTSPENENDESLQSDEASVTSAPRRSSTSSKSGKTPQFAKREKKRKIETDASMGEDSEQKKSKHSSSEGESNLKPSPEVMSRSGRKIKPKRFADFEDTSADESMTSTGKIQKNTPPKVNKLSKQDAPERLPEKHTEEEPIEDFICAEVDGEKIEIPLKLNRPVFTSSKNSEEWDHMVVKYALSLKKRLESGETLTESVDKHMDIWTKEKANAIEVAKEDQDIKLSHLKCETQLLDLDARIKISLSLHKAEPDQCLNLLDELLDLDVNPLMLKKHPEVVETIKKMRKYVGNTAHWKMSEDKLHVFNSKAALIRNKSEHVYNKFKTMFLVPNGKSFWEIFAKELDTFNKKTESLSMEEVFSLVKEPE